MGKSFELYEYERAERFRRDNGKKILENFHEEVDLIKSLTRFGAAHVKTGQRTTPAKRGRNDRF